MIEKLAKSNKQYLISLREELHKYPETDFEEFKTAEIIRRELDKFGIPYKISATTGTVGLIKGKNKGKTVLLRADIDGLPIKEETNVPYKSKIEGYMHACGHDAHTACLLGAAKILNDLKDNISGNIKLVFQPAEEGAGGAKPMIEEGVLENPSVDAAFALHVEPLEKTGNIQIKDGAVMACPDEFTINIIGRGGHGSAPHQCIDPIAVSAEIIKEYQGIVRNNINPMTPCVVSICSVHAGTCPNVIPSNAVMQGTVRAFDNETRFKIAGLLEKKACEAANAAGGECSFEYRALYPPVINNPNMNKLVANAAEKLNIIKDIITLDHASMAGDDFSYFAEKVPASYFKLGVGSDSLSHPIHSPKFNIDNASLVIGTALMAQIAYDYLTS